MANTPSQVALLPCPHCGEAEHIYPAYRVDKDGKCHSPYAIDCIGCGYDFTPREGMDVFAAWNRRASLTYEKCSVIQDEQAHYVMDLIRRDVGEPSEAEVERVAEALDDLHQQLVDCSMGDEFARKFARTALLAAKSKGGQADG